MADRAEALTAAIGCAAEAVLPILAAAAVAAYLLIVSVLLPAINPGPPP